MPTAERNRDEGWASAWPDALAFAGGLALAGYSGWKTKDLVWSLWLSSLAVGYGMIVWMIFAPLWQKAQASAGASIGVRWGSVAAYGFGTLFILAFFTVHFGGFHFVHSVFLNTFFPVAGEARGLPGWPVYGQVVRDYWPFVILAAVAERQAFRWPKVVAESSSAVTPEAIAARKTSSEAGAGLMAPYKNVIRLHLLIFFFAFASFAKLESFLVYTVVYAAYFFPWRLVTFRRAAVAA